MKLQSEAANSLILHMREILPTYVDVLTKYRKPTLDEMKKYYDTYHNRDYATILADPAFSSCDSVPVNDEVGINFALNEFMQCIAAQVDCGNGLYHPCQELKDFYKHLVTVYASYPMTLAFIEFALRPMLLSYTNDTLVASKNPEDIILSKINDEGMHKHPVTQLTMDANTIREIADSNFTQARCACCRQFYPFNRLTFATNNYTFGVCEACRSWLSVAESTVHPEVSTTSFFSESTDAGVSESKPKTLEDYFK